MIFKKKKICLIQQTVNRQNDFIIIGLITRSYTMKLNNHNLKQANFFYIHILLRKYYNRAITVDTGERNFTLQKYFYSWKISITVLMHYTCIENVLYILNDFALSLLNGHRMHQKFIILCTLNT